MLICVVPGHAAALQSSHIFGGNPPSGTPQTWTLSLCGHHRNRFEDADRFFERRCDVSPMHATAYGMISYIKAIFTFEPDMIEEAHRCAF
jgi:hypothetical protein